MVLNTFFCIKSKHKYQTKEVFLNFKLQQMDNPTFSPKLELSRGDKNCTKIYKWVVKVKQKSVVGFDFNRKPIFRCLRKKPTQINNLGNILSFKWESNKIVKNKHQTVWCAGQGGKMHFIFKIEQRYEKMFDNTTFGRCVVIIMNHARVIVLCYFFVVLFHSIFILFVKFVF